MTEYVNKQQRSVLMDKYLLDQQIGELMNFLTSDTYQHLGNLEKERLQRQKRIMQEFACVLDERIAAFGIQDEE